MTSGSSTTNTQKNLAILSNKDNRCAFAIQLLKEEFGLETESVEEVGSHNTFVIVATLGTLPSPLLYRPAQPGTVELPNPLPAKLVVRIANPATMDNPARKIENEVAAIALLHASTSKTATPVANLYAWSKDGPAWMVMEFMDGIPLQKVFKDLSVDQKRSVISEMASFVKTLQSVRLPTTNTPFGGFAFDDAGTIVMSNHPLGYGGPYVDSAAYHRGMIETQLALADKHTAIRGWVAEGVRDRVDRFMSDPNGFAKVAQGLPQEVVLTHFDFGIINTLVDPTSFRVTAFIDFELAHAGPPSDEYLNGLQYLGHLHAGPHESEEESRHAVALTAPGGISNDYPLEGETSDNGWDWQTMRIADTAFAEKDVMRPRTIAGMNEAARVYWFAQEICQWYFYQERWLKRVNVEEETAKAREKLSKFLDDWGF